MEMELSVVPLHHKTNYMADCCKLINDEWKRSETARMRSLESSSDTLPTSLILLRGKKLIGHLKLSSIPSIKTACFVESVVIERELRGQGFGTVLMNKAEEYCKNYLHLNTIYLSTKGQEGFYNKLGYMECPPVSIYGSSTQKTSTCLNSTFYKKNNVNWQGAPTPPPMPTTEINNNAKTYMKKTLI